MSAAATASSVPDGDDGPMKPKVAVRGKPKAKTVAKPRIKKRDAPDAPTAPTPTAPTPAPTSTKKARTENETVRPAAPLADSGDEAPASPASTPAPSGPTALKKPVRRRPAGGAAAAAQAAVAEVKTPLDIAKDVLTTPNRMVNDATFEALIPLMLKSARINTGAGRSMVVLHPTMLQAVLSAWYNAKDSVTKENVYTKLGTTQQAIEAADLIVSVLHGPHTENLAKTQRMYGDGTTPNYHWSIVAYSPEHNHAYHYDSKHPMNEDRCVEVLGVLRGYGVLPERAHHMSAPAFFPQQSPTDAWTCGYFALAAVHIMANKSPVRPITEDDIIEYRLHFETMGSATGSYIRQQLSALALYGAPASQIESDDSSSESE